MQGRRWKPDTEHTEDGEPSEEPHGASDETQLGLRLDLLVSYNVVEGCCVKVDPNRLKGGLYLHLASWCFLTDFALNFKIITQKLQCFK